MKQPNELIIEVGTALVLDPEYRNDPDWEIIAIVFDFVGGGKGCFGYIFRKDGSWKASLPDDENDAILLKMAELQNAMQQDTGRKWLRALVHITRSDQGMNISFEYDDPKRWTIAPNNLEASVAALKP